MLNAPVGVAGPTPPDIPVTVGIHPNQSFCPSWLRGPPRSTASAQILSMAAAWIGSKQLGPVHDPAGDAMSVGSPDAVYLNCRGSSTMPSATVSRPSTSQAAVACADALLYWAVVKALSPEPTTSSRFTRAAQPCAKSKLFQ